TIHKNIHKKKTQTQDNYHAIQPEEKKEYYNLSSAQKRLYILQQMELNSTAYNMPGIIPLEKKIEPAVLQIVFKTLIRRHESLRTSFHMIQVKPGTPGNQTSKNTDTSSPHAPGMEIPVQVLHDNVEFEIETIKTETGAHENNTFFRPFDMTKAPLLRVGIVENSGKQNYMMVDMHHIISDAASHEILQKEFLALAAGKRLEPLKLQYRDYARWQNSPKQKEAKKQQ
ncbi:MAG: hypothetical protein GY757_19660, partial [bacterium]|nr:hypothetical protein [bacterium]